MPETIGLLLGCKQPSWKKDDLACMKLLDSADQDFTILCHDVGVKLTFLKQKRLKITMLFFLSLL